MNNDIDRIDMSILFSIELNQPINYHKIFKKICNYEEIINYYLKSISLNSKKKYLNNRKGIINILYKNCYCRNNIIKDEASIIVDDLVEKVFNINNRSLNIPISINNLIDYSISSLVNNKNIVIVIKLIIIKLAIINYCFKL